MKRIWHLAHNLIAHPLLALCPGRVADWVHDYTAERAYGRAKGNQQ